MDIKFADGFWESFKNMFSFKAKVINFFCNIKWFFQRIFRSYHASDCDLWGLSHHLADVILPKLKAFRRSNLHGYPQYFSDDEDHPGEIGGGFDKWMETLDDMIFAFEFMQAEEAPDESKIRKEFNKKYGDWEEKTEANKKTMSWYRNEDGLMTSEVGDELVSEHVYYYNNDLYMKHHVRAQEGLEKFGKFFWNLWD